MFRKQMFLLVIALALFVAIPACAQTWNLAADARNGIGISSTGQYSTNGAWSYGYAYSLAYPGYFVLFNTSITSTSGDNLARWYWSASVDTTGSSQTPVDLLSCASVEEYSWVMPGLVLYGQRTFAWQQHLLSWELGDTPILRRSSLDSAGLPAAIRYRGNLPTLPRANPWARIASIS